MIPDLDLVKQIKTTGDENALLELVNRHSGIYYDTVKRNAPMNRLNDTYDDFYRRKEAEFYKAAKSFDESRGVKFVTWLASQTRYSCLSARSKQKEDPDTVEYNIEFGEVLEETPETEFLKKEDIKEIFTILKEKCRDRVARVFELKFFGNDGRGMTFKEICKEENCSYQACQQAYQQAIDIIKKDFKR
jgi:RNA polymerase sigma factor (sigma-70 family)